MSGKSPADGTSVIGLSVADASAAVGLSKITVLRRVKSGAWPGARSGRKWLVSNDFVRALAAEIRSGRQVVIEDYAAAWMAGTLPVVPEAVAS